MSIYDDANEFRKLFNDTVSTLEISIPLIVPVNENEDRILKVGLDMLSQLKEDISSCKSLEELDQYVDVDKLSRHWSNVKQRMKETSVQSLNVMLNERVMECVDEDAL